MRHTVRKFTVVLLIVLGWMNMPAQAFLASGDQNIWPVLSHQFSMPKSTKHYGVQQQINSDLRHPKYIHMLTENAKPYVFYVYQETKKYHLPAELALLPMIESDYMPKGSSSAGAVGLWQLMPGTADLYGVKMNFWYDGRRSTAVSTKVALRFLSSLYRTFNHNWLLALAAYNAGPGTVMAAIHYNQEHGRPTDFWALPLPQQTKEYIPKLLALAAIIQHPHTYGVHLAAVPDKSVTSTVTIKKETPLETIANLAHTSVSTVKKLNPALRRQSTPPHQIVTLILPANKKPVFDRHLAVQKEMQKEIAQKHLTHYKVKKGDSLSVIAMKFKTTIALLEKINSLHDGFIRANQPLLVPHLITTDDGHTTHITKKITPKIMAHKKPVIDKKLRHVSGISKEHTYVVKRGDNLHRLAAEFHTTTYHIMEHNHLKNADLSIGERLSLPNA